MGILKEIIWSEEVQLAGLQGSIREEDARRERILKARHFIDASFEEAIDLERIAKAASYAPTHFHRLFKKEVGETPHHYVTRKRIERARQLLLATDLDVTTICMEVGFSSLGSFSTLFTRHVGYPPSRYRRRFVRPGWCDPRVLVPYCFFGHFIEERKIREAAIAPSRDTPLTPGAMGAPTLHITTP